MAEGSIEQLTYDHSQVGRLFRDGAINERQARMHPRRNVLNQVIGAACQFVKPQVGTVHLKPGDWFLFCSDGIVDGLWNRQIEEEISSGVSSNMPVNEVAEKLLERAFANAGKDDTTLFVVRIMEES